MRIIFGLRVIHAAKHSIKLLGERKISLFLNLQIFYLFIISELLRSYLLYRVLLAFHLRVNFYCLVFFLVSLRTQGFCLIFITQYARGVICLFIIALALLKMAVSLNLIVIKILLYPLLRAIKIRNPILPDANLLSGVRSSLNLGAQKLLRSTLRALCVLLRGSFEFISRNRAIAKMGFFCPRLFCKRRDHFVPCQNLA